VILEVPLRPAVDWVANFKAGLAQVTASAPPARE
jgi:hypothetical protein